MVNKYTITVKNNSGAHQHYALFNKPPKVTGLVQSQIWSNVFATGNTPKNSTAKFSVYTQYYAIVGNSEGSPADGVQVNVTAEREVNLGSTKPDGEVVPGTTLGLSVSEDAPEFDDTTFPDGAYKESYEIKTKNDFTINDAKKHNYMIGLGGAKTGSGSMGPAATFMPEPNVDYQIEPVNVYYLTFGNYTQGALIDVNKIGSLCTIDYGVLNDDVTVVHDDHGNLVVQK
ncbi:hypothetical protein N8I77_008480 [Diaporthe amygdali]|uniref:Uncharacterized protein n=1 Tax=Phomopsis amygdali TaxID=1214568 RepID=A0AAD9SDX0_PHOAM|nr:hypothetical protein N8I77_008480 [Diaporthe amygdali]